MAATILEVRGLHATVQGKEILKGVDLTVKAGEVHAVMGPNGSGKSTLVNVIAGHPAFVVTAGEVSYQGKNLLELSADKRARAGIFLAFQYPVEIPGVRNSQFLRASLNAVRQQRGQDELEMKQFTALLKEKMTLVEMPPTFTTRNVNEGFSGGEKKRNEILQMALLEPTLALGDETDSGLDIDALRTVANGVNHLRSPERAMVLVTHYQRLLEYITPDVVHVLLDGRLVKTGDRQLALELEAKGYEWIRESVAAGRQA